MADKKYWTGLEELHQTPEFENASSKEFQEDLPVEEFLGNKNLSETSTGRRDFLKFLGFSVTAATVAACEAPVIKSIPFVNKPEEITPGVANYYASTFYDGHDFGSVLVKTREGRPIHITPNKDFGLNKGGINARINSSVLSLYNTARVQNPMWEGEATSWSVVDGKITKKLSEVAASTKQIFIVSSTVISPSEKRAIEAFKAKYGSEDSPVVHVNYDAVSYSGIRQANKEQFGEAIIPSYDFSKAKTVVSVAADFLSSWLYGSLFSIQYGKLRNPEDGVMSKHFQFESNMSLTGSNADYRIAVAPSQEAAVLTSIYNHLAKKAGASTLKGAGQEVDALTKKAAEELWKNKGASLVVAGANNKGAQMVANAINQLLGNYGKTLSTSKTIQFNQGNEAEFDAFVNAAKKKQVGAAIFCGVNPVYNHANGTALKDVIAQLPLSIAISEYADETASACKVICPDNNYLESWNDAEPVTGEYALTQPTISPLYKTRQRLASLLAWSGNTQSTLSFIKETWANNIASQTLEGLVFTDFWNKALHNGSYISNVAGEQLAFDSKLNIAADHLKKTAPKASAWELSLYQKEGIGTGNQAQNPWLQELPDPITKVTWDNYLTMSPVDVKEMGLNAYIGQESPASVVKLTAGGKTISVPVFPCPGQKKGTLGLALGYGRGANGENLGKAAYQTGEYGGYELDENGNKKPIGVNAFQMAIAKAGETAYTLSDVSIEATGEEYPLACTQTHHTIMGRESVVKETSLSTFIHGHKHDYNHSHELAVHEDGKSVKKPVKEIDLWNAHPVEHVGHRWGMSIDLSKCLGCSACVTACHSENNVPVVGKDEVRRSRDMHWLRIDRYFSSSEDAKKHSGEDYTYAAMEVPEDNPSVVHMPMMCQHCNHAPCETVCPVAATTHSNEGLNQMTYNRCIGTRYCANNCPYKVRRFNWFNYKAYKKFTEVNPAQDDMGRMVLNPDVAVRSRGVMEKCSMCVQRIQAGKLDAKKASTPVQDGAIQTACSESCPTGAITFGDLNDKEGSATKKANSDRGYLAIEEVGTQPNVYYMVKVRNTESHEAKH